MKRFLIHIMKLCWDTSAVSKANIKRFEREQGGATVLKFYHAWRGDWARGLGGLNFLLVSKEGPPGFLINLPSCGGRRGMGSGGA